MAGLNVGSVAAKFTADISNLKKGVEDARTSVSGLGNHVTSIGGSIKSFFSTAGEQAQTMASTLNVAGAAVAVGIGLVGKAAVSSAADMEMLRSSMDVLTGSTENGAKMFKDLVNFANTTPFETESLAQATKTMLGFGVAQKDILPNLQMLGDISMGSAEKLGGLSLVFSQVKSQGKLMGQDLLQMINNGFNPLSVISQKTGESMTVLKEKMSEGKISFEDVRSAMEASTKEGGLYFKGMEKGAATLSGTYSTLKDTVMSTLRAIVGMDNEGNIAENSILFKIKKQINDLIVYFTEHQGEITAFFNNIVTSVQGIGQSQGFQLLMEAVKTFGSWIAANKDTVIPFLQGIAIAIGTIWVGVNIINGLTAAFAALTSPLGLIILAVGLLYTAWQKDWGGIREKFDAVKTSVIELKDGFKTAWDGIVAAFTTAKDTITGMVGGLTQAFNDHKTAIEVTAGIITTLFLPSLVLMATQAAITGGQFALAFTQVMIQAGIETAITAGKITWQFITSMVQAGIEAVRTSVAISINFVKSLIDGAMYIGAFALQGWSMVASFVAQAWNAGIATLAVWAHNAAMLAASVTTGVMTAATWLLNAAILVLTSPITLVILAIVALIAIGVLLYKNWDIVKEKASEVGAWIASKWGEIKGAVVKYIEDLITSASEWGEHMMQNLSDGIAKGVQKVKDTVEGVKNWIKDKLGFSYNKYMPSEVWGQHMLENFAKGIDKSKAMLNNQLSSVIDMNTEGLTSAAGMGSQVNQTINANISNGVDINLLAEKMRFTMRANY